LSAGAAQKHAWVLLFAFFVIQVFRAMLSLANPSFDYSAALTGLTWSQIGSEYPGLAAFINGKLAESSTFLLGFSIFGMAISAASFRRKRS
jgi:hypothetical protein